MTLINKHLLIYLAKKKKYSWVYISPKKKMLIWKGEYTPMLVAALFTTAKIWKQLKCPLIENE